MRYIGKKARFGFVEGCELLGLLGEQLIGSLVGPVKKENRQQQNRQQRDGDEGRALDGSGLRNVILQGQALGLVGELKGVSFLLECVFGFQPGSGSGLGFTAQAIGHLLEQDGVLIGGLVVSQPCFHRAWCAGRPANEAHHLHFLRQRHDLHKMFLGTQVVALLLPELGHDDQAQQRSKNKFRF
jgi:hypothetical protein